MESKRISAAWCGVCLLGAALALGMMAGEVKAEVTVLGVQYRPDQSFPEHECFWQDALFPGLCPASSPMGGTAHVYVRNNGSSSVTVQDMLLSGISLNYALEEQEQVVKRHPCSIWFASLTSEQLQALLTAGEPVWYKADPPTIAPGQTTQIVVRLRQTPSTSTINVGVVHSAGTVSTTVPIEADAPQVASTSFSEDLTKVYLYWRRGSGGSAPVTLKMDGVDVTANATLLSDPTVGLAVSVLQLAQPLSVMSFHVFQGTYADGKTASAGSRVWANKFLYGTWGAQPGDDDDLVAARAWVDDATNRGVNSLVVTLGSSALGDLLGTSSGRQYAADHGYGFVIDYPNKWSCSNPEMWFIRDEPDAADSRVSNLPGNKMIGSLAMMCLERAAELRSANPSVPTALNIDGTYKPFNWYNYGQVPDVLMTDPYYQARLRSVCWTTSVTDHIYSKATYIYAVSQLAQSSCEPNPLHVILYSCEYKDPSGAVFPFAPPACKRIEVYYALAGGAKGLSYWWYLPGKPSNGLGDGGPDALALWREIGLLGAEVKTAAPLLVNSCPSTMAVEGSDDVWVRPLLVGSDTVILLVVNDDYYNDEEGCHYIPVPNASVSLTLPPWLDGASAFEIAAGGISDVNTELDGSQLQMNLGTLDVTRMIVLTANSQLRASIEQRYLNEVYSGVYAFAPEVCLQNIPPRITQHPESGTICAGDSVILTIGATGSAGLSYQWQKNQVDISDGGGYSGTATNTLTITDAVTGQAGNYRCVVTNTYGTANSNEAALTVLSCNPNCLQNLGFESGFSVGVGNGWTKFVKSGDVTCSDETVEKHSGAHCQEIFSPDDTHDGGVYQQFTATPGQAYTLKAWFKVFSPEGTGIAEGMLGLDPTGGTDPNSPNIIWSSKPYEYWSQKSWTITAQSDYITLYLRGRSTKDPTKKKTAYVWIDDIELAPASPTDDVPQAMTTSSVRWRWLDLASETGYRVRDAGGVDKSGLLPADVAQWTETSGIAANTQYTRRICAINDCGESDPSTGQTAYSLIQAPTDVAIGSSDTTSIAASAVGTFSNLGTGSSAVLIANTTTGTDSGWLASAGPWTSSSLSPNTEYSFLARARNGDGVETTECEVVTGWTLSVAPVEGSVIPSPSDPGINTPVTWTAVGGFGAGTVASYRYAWDQSPTHVWTGSEPSWSSGTLATQPTAAGTWYLHLQGYNGQDVPNGTFDYAVETGPAVAADLDGDGDVDLSDFGLFQTCFNGADQAPLLAGCEASDFDGDNDVDAADFAIFAGCLSGPNLPADPDCAN